MSVATLACGTIYECTIAIGLKIWSSPPSACNDFDVFEGQKTHHSNCYLSTSSSSVRGQDMLTRWLLWLLLCHLRSINAALHNTGYSHF